MTNKVYLYLKGEEELGEIIEKIRKTKEKEIILVIPQETKSLRHHLNLELFKKEIDKLDKKVYFDTDDGKLINLAYQFKIPIFLAEVEEDKSIVDIKPPRPPRKKEEEITIPLAEPTKPKAKFNFFTFLKYLFSLFLVIGVSFLLWVIFQTRAEIYVETEKTPVELNDVLVLQEGVLNPDYQNKILPAEYKKIELIKVEVATPTGKVFSEEKPLLNVVFLNYLEQEIPLVLGTRIAFNENVFRTTEKIVIPPAQDDKPGEKKTTAFLDILKDENLKINQGENLKIVALEGKKTSDGRKWSDVLKVKTESDYDLSQMKPVTSVTSEDLTKIKLNLEKFLKESIKTNLSLQYPDKFFYFDPSLVKIEIQNISHGVGEKTDKVSASGKATFETMFVPKKEFDDFVRNLVNKKILDEKKNLIIKNLKYEKIDLLDINPQKKTMTLGILAKADLIPDLNPETLKEKIKGQSLANVQDYFSKLEGVIKVRIKVFPQWKEDLPKDIKRIKIFVE